MTPSGTALPPAQVTALTATFGASPAGAVGCRIVVAFDGDPAGLRAAARAYALLRDAAGLLEYARLPDASDPAGVLAARGPGGLRAALDDRLPLAGLVLDERLDAVHGRPRWARRDAAARLIADLAPPAVTRRPARAVAGATGTGVPENAAPLHPYAIAGLLPALPRHLVARAADRIGVTASELLLALADAAEPAPATGAGGRASRR